MHAATEGTVRTADGRTIAYAEFGSAEAPVVFYCHGLPGTRRDFDQPAGDAALAQVPARFIGIDRPGFGLSDFQAGRTYAGWPRDLAAVADELGVERFAVLGYSAGGLYALASAQAMPDRVTSVGIVSGAGPAGMPSFRRGLARTDAVMTRLSRVVPPLAYAAIAAAARQAKGSPERFSAQFDRGVGAAEREVHRDPVTRAALRTVFLEATRGGPRGVVEDYRIWSRPAGIDFGRIDVPVRMWQGDADTIVPVRHAQYLAGRLPRAELAILPGVGHLHTGSRWAQFLAGTLA